MYVDFSKYRCRCSSLGHIMTDPQSKADKDAGNLSESAKTHLTDIYVAMKYGRKTDITNKYVEKGRRVEEDSITLYSRVKKTFFKKNDKRLYDEFIEGEPDLFKGLDIKDADEVIDAKSSWDIYTFFRVHSKSINPLYKWQLTGYMRLTGARRSTLAYCLVNTPDDLIEAEIRKLSYQLPGGTLNPDYENAKADLIKAMTFDDIPLAERVIEIQVERNEADIQRISDKVVKCRAFLFELQDKHSIPDLVLLS